MASQIDRYLSHSIFLFYRSSVMFGQIVIYSLNRDRSKRSRLMVFALTIIFDRLVISWLRAEDL
ncbi:hypothetical protein [Chamaesiphon minutus]|uniref:hypothetical protein n=1 Tax=Chamaesiphon minutus TaxID=1173032 RepID=UPI0002FA0C78|nr:hypothetical protein [Chamaesiphon minutus]